jgi:hypothetical protein
MSRNTLPKIGRNTCPEGFLACPFPSPEIVLKPGCFMVFTSGLLVPIFLTGPILLGEFTGTSEDLPGTLEDLSGTIEIEKKRIKCCCRRKMGVKWGAGILYQFSSWSFALFAAKKQKDSVTSVLSVLSVAMAIFKDYLPGTFLKKAIIHRRASNNGLL